MIPPDVASRLRIVTQDLPAPTQPATPVSKIADALSDLVPGQRVFAEIQAMLPNGTYRAMVAQRDVTLALPFSAKPGDSLELEVVESDGKLTLAYAGNRNAAAASPQSQSAVTATLSRAGQMIGDLLGKVDEQGKKPSPLALNGNQPLIDKFPKNAAELTPVLKEALSKSGMFFEAHQARWVQGNLSTAALLQEPQGKLSATLLQGQAQTHLPQAAPTAPSNDPNAAALKQPAGNPPPAAGNEAASTQKNLLQNPIPADLTPLVRQQLDALATQNYVWQGQVWPGQQMYWEIQEEPDGRRSGRDEENPERWQTRLQLNLPGLGGIAAEIRLRPGNAIDLTLVTDNDQSRQLLTAAGQGLQQQLDAAGLALAAMVVRHEQADA